MITAYAIIVTFFLGAFVRHNYAEMRASHKLYRASKKFERSVARARKERETAEAKLKDTPAV